MPVSSESFIPTLALRKYDKGTCICIPSQKKQQFSFFVLSRLLFSSGYTSVLLSRAPLKGGVSEGKKTRVKVFTFNLSSRAGARVPSKRLFVSHFLRDEFSRRVVISRLGYLRLFFLFLPLRARVLLWAYCASFFSFSFFCLMEVVRCGV